MSPAFACPPGIRSPWLSVLGSGTGFAGLFAALAYVAAATAILDPAPAMAQQDPFAEPARQKRTLRRVRLPDDPYALNLGAPRRAPLARSVPRAQTVRAPAPKVVAPKPAPAAKPDAVQQRAPETLVAVISLASQRMHVYGADGVVGETRISSGTAGHRTPTGVFSVLQRNRFHRSNIYSGAPMPYMQRLTWSGIALHEGVVPNYPASHGCIRMPSGFASRMWGLGRIGMRVLVSPSDIAPLPIEHARLPVPVMTVLDGTSSDAMGQIVHRTSTGDAPAVDAPRQIAPYPLAHVRRIRAVAAQAAAEKEIKLAQEALAVLSAEANRASERLRKAEADLAAIEAERDEVQAALSRAQTEAAEAEIRPRLVALTERLDTARRALDGARKAEFTASDAAFDAAKALRAAQERHEDAAAAVRLSAASLEPISIFVSRKEGMVFVRQGFTPLHEEPIVIAEPERPLGTHVFSAIDVTGEGAGLRWLVTTLPSSPVALDAEPRRRGAPPPPPKSSLPQSTAAEALDRFELPPATVKLIGDRLWNGATLTVSDYGISGETGRGTDFVVLTK